MHARQSGRIATDHFHLLANGLDALNTDGTLYVRLSRTRHSSDLVRVDRINLTIADNGCGIRVHNLKRIFEPFFTTKQSVGTGLGLWVTEELVRKHNGVIKVRSKEGHGTVFRISLPAISPPTDNQLPIAS
jgi:signal transduction histidine kinase